MTKEQEFRALTEPVIEFIKNNYHPHVTVIIDTNSAELLEGIVAYDTNFDAHKVR